MTTQRNLIDRIVEPDLDAESMGLTHCPIPALPISLPQHIDTTPAFPER